ncbi:MAG: single-stranded-DNA-specific exonuclease RecJ [Bacteroidales bacterium]|nr:single-stranded-DNA-specific exonuclease RecJ [Bacteroidales bacterium]
MIRAWKIRENGFNDTVNKLADELSVSPVISSLLVQRGIQSFEHAKAFFRPDLKQLYNPFLMKDMNKAVQRLTTALEKEQKILVYGDYDVDGTTSVAMVYTFLKKYHHLIDYYIPERYAEGYGVSQKGVEYAIEHGISLIIALDCGIKALEKVAFAKSHDIDFIICDHHTPGDVLPDAVAVLDPERPDSGYPFRYLSGCGVAFKMLQAFSNVNHIPFEEIADFLDLLAVSIASDIVPMIDENRILTYFGLRKLNENPSVGLKSIIKVAGLAEKTIAVDDIIFKIGPRINAAGRIESGKQAVALLTSRDPDEAMLHCEKINFHNQTRRNLDKSITEEAIQEASSVSHKYKYSVILFNPGWHKGVVGIVASRLIEIFYRPTVVLTESNGLATGSARSIPGFDLYDAVSQCADLLESYGGHKYAAGLTLKTDNLPKFRERFDEVVSNSITQDQLIPQIEIDTELNFKDITPTLFRIIKQFEPFGPENTNPVFFAENVSDNGYARRVGAEEDHLQLGLIQEEQPFSVYKAIAFNQGSCLTQIKTGKAFDIAYTLEENTFRGNSTIQLIIKDIKFDR